MDINIIRLGKSIDREEAKRLLAFSDSGWGDEALIKHIRSMKTVDGNKIISDSDGVRVVLEIAATHGCEVEERVIIHGEPAQIIGPTRDPKVWKVRINGKIKLVDGVNITKIMGGVRSQNSKEFRP